MFDLSKKFKSNQVLLQDVLLCYRWILMTSFGIPPKIKMSHYCIWFGILLCCLHACIWPNRCNILYRNGKNSLKTLNFSVFAANDPEVNSVRMGRKTHKCCVSCQLIWRALLAQWHSTVLYSTQIYTFCRRLRKVMLKE